MDYFITLIFLKHNLALGSKAKYLISFFPTISHFIPNTSSSSAIITANGKAMYIQDFTKSMCQSQASSSAITVRDRRDNQDYTVRYINGNCWMTRNLAIGCNGSGNTYGSSISSKTLTSTYSNVSNSWSTPTTDLFSGIVLQIQE